MSPDSARRGLAFPRRLSLEGSLPAAALMIVFVAFILRVYRLDGIGLEGDEAFSIRAAYSGFSSIIHLVSTSDPHPPFYYALLRIWYLLAGDSEFALRFPSLAANVLTVAFLFKMARFFSWRAAGALGAVFLALNPYQVMYSHQVRMYTLVALLGLAAVSFLLEGLRHRRRLYLGLYALFMLVSLYVHYYALFLLAFTSLLLLAWLWYRRGARREIAYWIGTQVIIAGLFLPWMVLARPISFYHAPFLMGAAEMLTIVRDSLLRYSLGYSAPMDIGFVLSLGFLAVAIAGPWFGRQTDGGYPAWLRYTFLIGYLSTPLVLSSLVSLLRPILAVRYLMVSAPAFYLALGLGVAGLYRRASVLGIASGLFLISTQGFSLFNYYFDPRYAVVDFREAAAYIREHTRPGDAIVLDGWSQTYQFWYYYTLKTKDPVPSYLFPLGESGDWQQSLQKLDEIMVRHQGVWLLDYDVFANDPGRVVETHLARNYYQALSRRIRTNRVAYYASAPPVAPSPVSLNLNCNQEVLLKDLSISTTTVKPGEVIPLALRWQAMKATEKEYVVSWRLLDREGHLVLQRDSPPASGFSSTRTWVPGEELVDRYGMPIPIFLVPDWYSLTIAIYDKASGETCYPQKEGKIIPGGQIPLARIDVLDAQPGKALESMMPTHGMSFSYGGMGLVGFDLAGDRLNPGDTISVKLFWQVAEDIDRDYTVVTRLMTDKGKVLQENKTGLGPPWFPTSRWRMGRTFASYLEVPVPARAATAAYHLSLSVKADGLEENSFSGLPRVSVTARERNFKAPAIPYPMAATFGGVIDLLGYDLQPAPNLALEPGSPLHLTLAWRALGEMNSDYKVFTHLVGEDGRIYGQEDSIPLKGKAPTSGWVPGEILLDRYDIPVRPEAPPGKYALIVGLYEPERGSRLSLVGGRDSVILANLVVSSTIR